MSKTQPVVTIKGPKVPFKDQRFLKPLRVGEEV
jgi:hypothetical protein